MKFLSRRLSLTGCVSNRRYFSAEGVLLCRNQPHEHGSARQIVGRKSLGNFRKEASLALSGQASVHRKRRSWTIPALIAFISFLGGLASNLVASYIQTGLEPYRPWVWGVCILAGMAAVVAAIMDARQAEEQPAILIENDGLVTDANRIK